MMERRAEAEGVRWYLSDHLGTVRDLADAAGEVIDHLAYDAFGNVLAESNPAAGDRFRFTGREFDAATGQYYYRARYYDGTIGRFTSEDPLGLSAGDVNLYRYAGNGPVAALDPLGLSEYQWHHRLPQAHRGLFEMVGLDIDAAEWGVLLPVDEHRALNHWYDQAWRWELTPIYKKLAELGHTPNPEEKILFKEQILAILRKLETHPEYLQRVRNPKPAGVSWQKWQRLDTALKDIAGGVRESGKPAVVKIRKAIGGANKILKVVGVVKFAYTAGNDGVSVAVEEWVEGQLYPLNVLAQQASDWAGSLYWKPINKGLQRARYQAQLSYAAPQEFLKWLDEVELQSGSGRVVDTEVVLDW